MFYTLKMCCVFVKSHLNDVHSQQMKTTHINYIKGVLFIHGAGQPCRFRHVEMKCFANVGENPHAHWLSPLSVDGYTSRVVW